MVTTLIKTKNDWDELVSDIKSTKLLGSPCIISGEPNEMPCYAISQIIRDNNGFSINFNFIYKKHAEKLMKL